MADSLRATIAELTVELGSSHPTPQIAEEAARAVHDLAGSTRVEALPELVTRLVRVRLTDESGSPVRGSTAWPPVAPDPLRGPQSHLEHGVDPHRASVPDNGPDPGTR